MGITASQSPNNSTYLPVGFQADRHPAVLERFEELRKRPIASLEELKNWLLDRGTLNAFLSERFAELFVAFSRDTGNDKKMNAYQEFVQDISPLVAEMDQKLSIKLNASSFSRELPAGTHGIYLRNLRNSLRIYREANVRLATEVQIRSKDYGRLFGAMTVGMDGAQLTLQEAGLLLEGTERRERETVYRKINDRMVQDADTFEEIFSELLTKRNRIAANADFDSYTDYRFADLNRFDYQPKDCLDFHESVHSEVLPLLDRINRHRRETLQLDRLRPWDLSTDISGRSPLRPFDGSVDLLEKSIRCLDRINPDFGDVVRQMREAGRLDIEARPGKRPGAYNMPMLVSGLPFLFMNATSSSTDVRTFLHESGHAIHSYLIRDLRPVAARRVPSEIAELAAMSMELFSMEHWDIFYADPEDLRRARLQQLEMVLKVLPWIATIDAFQHWLYAHPDHDRAERAAAWSEIYYRFGSDEVDYQGLEDTVTYQWHKQIHLFEVPFYYVEYGMAQLGAVALWKQYCENPTQTIRNYRNALELGYTRSIPEVYETAGISFDFSKTYVRELTTFVQEKIAELL
ncbi:MAG: M3 family oligoendopeptidase [Saprospiraceae bacterium]